MGAERVNGRAAKLLGQTQQITITDVMIAPQLLLSVETDIAGIGTSGAVVRLVDVLRGRAVFSPITPQAARNWAASLLAYADQETSGGGRDGSSTVHE
jgi:hypothetical protein